MYTSVSQRVPAYTGVMTQAAQELSTRDVRTQLADVINDAATRGTITYITSRGRRIAAVVSVGDAEAIEHMRTPGSQTADERPAS